jgi:hypothetical protein
MKSKLTILVSVILSLVFITSCGSSKESANQSGRTKRDVDECVTLAEQENAHLRAYGTATAFNENIAVENAEFDAVTKLARRMELAVEGVSERFNLSGSKGLTRTEEQLQKNHIKTYVDQTIKGYRIIKTSMWDRKDGGIDAYICVELAKNTEDVLSNIYNSMSKDDLLGIEFDRLKFIKETKDDLEKYKNRDK